MTMLRCVIAASAALALVACDSPAGEQAASAAGPPPPTTVAQSCTGKHGILKLGWVTVNLQSLFFNQVSAGAKTIAARAGAALQIVSGNDDSVAQANAIDNLITNDVDVIIVDAIDTDGIKPSIRKAAAAGIPVVAVDAPVDDPAVGAQVGTANVQGGAQIGEKLLEISKGTGTVGIVSALNSIIQLERQKGFTDTVKAGGMQIGTIVDGRNVQENAQTAAENLLTGNPNMTYVYATGEPALIGVVAAANSQGAASRLRAVGWDLSEQAVQALKAGWLKAVVQQNSFEIGYAAANAAIDHACGRKTPQSISIPTQIVTPDNVDQFRYFLESK
ncbi:MAG: substrate-binding domain-containing protein [Mycobacterium sp.]|nr:substrate-binding domain-containing protein [Mycobacterium sp.]